MSYSAHRPPEHEGRGDSRLPQIVRELRRAISAAQERFAHDSLRLEPAALEELAGILVDFAEDIHNRIGVWEAWSTRAAWASSSIPTRARRS